MSGDELSALLGRMALRAAGSERVTLDEIEGRLRALGSTAQERVASSKQNAIAVGIFGGAAVIVGAYMHGRRRGRRRASVVEIRKV